MDPQISFSECLARYILEKGKFVISKGRVKHSVFMPPSDLKLSVYRIAGLSENKVWEIGRIYVADKQGKSLLGRADIIALSVYEQNLKVESDPSLHPLHANIVDWPPDKEAQKEIALELADAAQLHLI